MLNRLDREGQRFDIVGVPFLVQCENFRSCLHLYRHVVEQALRFASPAEIDSFLDAMRSAQAKAGSSSFEWPNDFLPFTVCITSIAKVTMVQSSGIKISDIPTSKVYYYHS